MAVPVPTPACPQQTWPLSPPLHAALNRHGGTAFPNASPAKHQYGAAGLALPPRRRVLIGSDVALAALPLATAPEEAGGRHTWRRMAAAASGGRSRSVPRRLRAGPGPAAAERGRERGEAGGVSGRKDPFPGPAPLARPRVKRFLRGAKEKAPRAARPRLRRQLKLWEQREEAAAEGAARAELLLPQEPGFLEADPGEDTCTVTQRDIAEAVDIASAAKHFELKLEQFGPYRVDYTRDGRHLLLGGRRGHVAALEWGTKRLMCEINVMESVADVAWLHTESLVAVAQRRWLHVYDNQGLELNCLKRFPGVLRLQFLPFHLLLATANATGFLQYLDISVGQEVAALATRGGRLSVMAQNPANAIVHLGHSNGTVTLWCPSVPEPLVRLLCHRGAVRALAIDPTGTYMASAGTDRQLRVWDVRTWRALAELVLPLGAGHLHFSQRGLLAAACGDQITVFRGVGEGPPRPFLCHRPPCPPHALRFCPLEDVLGVGHGGGFSSLLVPGAGEANFDALELNPYRSRRQRQEWEVKALLEKIPAELLTLDPSQLGHVDKTSLEQKREERIQRLGFDPQAKVKFKPRRRVKGSDPQRRKRQVAHEQLRAAIRQKVEQREKKGGEGKKGGAPTPPKKRGALERFRK
ncbi:WD repeat-containing protein 46 [Caloenas nicobarica]|uniref:WD repeat-containing protein 46 n=1 Tax=Caloenas nicobarica TaxID=187106 RepID=UPI0032B85AAD